MNASERSAWLLALKIAIPPFLLSRFWTAFFVYCGHAQRPFLAPIPGGWEGISNWWLNPWTLFDSRHFLVIASSGYDAHTAAFFPLYPWLIGLAGDSPQAMAIWGIFISNFAFAAALAALYRLTEIECDSQAARLAVWLLAFCPTTAYFSAVYSESLFLLCFVLTFWAVRNNKWKVAAAFAFLAGLTRQVGVLIFFALFLEWRQARKRAESPSRPALLAAFAPLAALALWQLIVRWQVGDASRGIASQQEYLRAPVWPWIPVYQDFISIASEGADPVLWLHLAVTLLAIFIVLARWKRQPISYTTMIIGVMVMNFSLARTELPRTLPIARYMMTMFPFIQQIAVQITEVKLTRPTRFVLAAVYGGVCAFYAFRFGLKDFIS